MNRGKKDTEAPENNVESSGSIRVTAHTLSERLRAGHHFTKDVPRVFALADLEPGTLELFETDHCLKVEHIESPATTSMP